MKRTIGIIGQDGHGAKLLAQAIALRRPHVIGDIPDVTVGMGIDGCILVVSAIDGPMPQTREAILMARQFGIDSIVTFISHCDMVDDASLLDLLETEVRELMQKHQLNGKDAIIIRGSSKACIEAEKDAEKPVDELIKAIKDIKGRAPDPAFRVASRFTAQFKLLLPVDGGTNKAIWNRTRMLFMTRDSVFDGDVMLPIDRIPTLPGDAVTISFISNQPVSAFSGMGFVASLPDGDSVIGAGRVTEVI